ncbi:MAG: cation:dicarboxylase symporter family transporter, partial [Endomicrobium sp.]|nr:cation:dicarboxylase symporter family transporter [Endomicrobium sp.]
MADGKRGVFEWYFKTNLLLRIFLGLGVGGVVGVILAGMGADTAKSALVYIAPFGDAFVRLLKIIIFPVILFTLVVGT